MVLGAYRDEIKKYQKDPKSDPPPPAFKKIGTYQEPIFRVEQLLQPIIRPLQVTLLTKNILIG